MFHIHMYLKFKQTMQQEMRPTDRDFHYPVSTYRLSTTEWRNGSGPTQCVGRGFDSYVFESRSNFQQHFYK